MTPQAEALLKRIVHDIEIESARDRRNQKVIDCMKHLPLLGRAEVRLRRVNWPIALGVAAGFAWIIFCNTMVHAEDFADRFTGKIPCPTPGQPCKVLILTPQEENVLMQQNGVLDTAAQARALELGQFSVYLKTRIAAAPQGEVQKLSDPTPKGNPAKGAGEQIPAADAPKP